MQSLKFMAMVIEGYMHVIIVHMLQTTMFYESHASQVFHSHQLESGKIGDYCDGELFKSHKLFANNPCALQISLYYDDLEACNVLGSKAKIHKLSKCHVARCSCASNICDYSIYACM